MARPTPYTDVNDVLATWQAQIEHTLARQLVGIYLSGSLAVGDFDPASSDIDLVVVTDGPISAEQFTALSDLHTRFAGGGSPWAERIEAVYIPADVLRGPAAPPDVRVPVIERGGRLALDPLESGWSVQRYTLREHGVALVGPPPATLIDPVDPDEMRRSGAAISATWQEQATGDPSWLDWLRPRRNQAFVVLTLCRLLYTLELGGVASKPAAARWALATWGRPWAALIERVVADRDDPGTITAEEERDTLALMAYTAERFRQWLGIHGEPARSGAGASGALT